MKVIKYLAYGLGIFGLFIIVGAVGTNEIASDINVQFTTVDMLLRVLLGVILMGPSIFIR